MGNRGSQAQQDSEGRCRIGGMSLFSPLPMHVSVLSESYFSSLIYYLDSVQEKCHFTIWISDLGNAPLLPLSFFPPFFSCAHSSLSLSGLLTIFRLCCLWATM